MDSKKLEETKQKLKEHRDLFGCELTTTQNIDDAKNIFDLEDIIEKHRDFIKGQANGADASLDRFKRSLGVF